MSDQPNPPHPTAPPAPGWYPDPADGSRRRWWDGTQWTTQTTDSNVPFSPQGMTSPPNHGVLRPVGAWLGDTFSESFGRLGHFLPMVLLLLVPLSLGISYLTWSVLIDVEMVIDLDSGSTSVTGLSESPGLGIAGLALNLLLVISSYWLFGAATDQLQQAHKGEAVPWSASVMAGFKRLPRLVLGLWARFFLIAGLCLFVVVARAFLAAVIPPVGALVIILIPPIVWIVLWVRLCLVGTVAVVDTTNPISRAWRLTAGHFWALLGRFIVLALIFMGVWLSFSLIGSIFSGTPSEEMAEFTPDQPIEFKFSALLPENPAFYMIRGLFGALGTGLCVILLATASLVLHRDLSATEHSQASPPAPQET